MINKDSLDEGRIKLLLQLMLFAAVLSASTISIFHGDIRGKIKQFLADDHRVILSVVVGDVLGNGKPIKIVKVKTRGAILVEVYDSPVDGARKLLHTLKIPDPHDGYFHLNGTATNLALDDIDDDRIMEIIAPSFDANMVAHLNVYKYDPQIESFVPVSSTEPQSN